MAATTDPTATEPDAATADTGKPSPKGNSKRAEYEVFYCTGDFEDAQHAVEQGSWSYGGRYWSETNGGQRSARRQATEADTDAGATIRDVMENGEPVFFFCVPMRSMHPFRAYRETVESLIV